MSLSDSYGKKNRKQGILHFVSWYPSEENLLEGIFIQRQVELIASGPAYSNIVVKKNTSRVSVIRHLMALIGLFKENNTGSMKMVFLPGESSLYNFFFLAVSYIIWKKGIEKINS